LIDRAASSPYTTTQRRVIWACGKVEQVRMVTTFSIASILGEQIGKDDDEHTSAAQEQQHQQFMLNNSVQHLYNVFCKNAAAAAVAAARLNEDHQHKTNIMRPFQLGTNSSSAEFYPLHKINIATYQGKVVVAEVLLAQCQRLSLLFS
jgi:hypothetical protein